MRDAYEDIRGRGAQLIAVGNGTPEMAKYFMDERDIPFPLFVDPTRRAYRAAGLQRSLMAAIDPRSIVRGLRAVGRGHHQSRTRGDAFQQGGVLVLEAGGSVLMHFVSEAAGHYPKPEAILKALPAPG